MSIDKILRLSASPQDADEYNRLLRLADDGDGDDDSSESKDNSDSKSDSNSGSSGDAKPHGFVPGGPGGDKKCGKDGCGKGPGDKMHMGDDDKPMPWAKKS